MGSVHDAGIVYKGRLACRKDKKDKSDKKDGSDISDSLLVGMFA